eukprot:TRINITY_DN73016_c0_g1_i1.p1 TRINITY_DN73016_c0_g1~~TRINITY_DN73016_c0_g1_i1.p1  ORF type:complete len:191 (+),score=29.73 TRINITY_DN73016_c0_g1_i1:52-624(+)
MGNKSLVRDSGTVAVFTRAEPESLVGQTLTRIEHELGGDLVLTTAQWRTVRLRGPGRFRLELFGDRTECLWLTPQDSLRLFPHQKLLPTTVSGAGWVSAEEVGIADAVLELQLPSPERTVLAELCCADQPGVLSRLPVDARDLVLLFLPEGCTLRVFANDTGKQMRTVPLAILAHDNPVPEGCSVLHYWT